MKLWIDDLRPAPPGYVWAKNYSDAIDILATEWFIIDEISFDHDLGPDSEDGNKIAMWLESYLYEFPSERHDVDLKIHSMNPVGVGRLKATIESIKRILEGGV